MVGPVSFTYGSTGSSVPGNTPPYPPYRRICPNPFNTKGCVREFPDACRMMANENLAEWGSDGWSVVGTILTTIEAYGQGQIDLPKVPRDTNARYIRHATGNSLSRPYTKGTVARVRRERLGRGRDDPDHARSGPQGPDHDSCGQGEGARASQEERPRVRTVRPQGKCTGIRCIFPGEGREGNSPESGEFKGSSPDSGELGGIFPDSGKLCRTSVAKFLGWTRKDKESGFHMRTCSR
jgi:hypothetical protein